MPEDQTKNEPVADSNEQSAKPTESSPSDTSVSSEVKKMGIPKPIPRGGSTTALPEDEPLSEDTIHIDRSTIIDTQASSQDELDPQKRLKIFCYNCGQKLDLTDMTPFSKINCPSCSSEIIVPRWFDNYLLEELCGVGGMAVVYRGLDLALDREVAIKILNRESAESPGQNKLFLHEARTVATLNHFAILPIYTCGEYEGQAYFVMQYMSGGSLDVEIANAKGEGLLVDEACKWLKDIAEGLDNAKRHGIIHHDIKPGNFMLDSERNAKIGDFGISQALHDKSSEELAKLAASWGSPQYVSPEKIETGVESHLGDIYSLGATFYHVLTGVTPYDNDDTKELLKAKTLRDPLQISKHNPDLPPPLCELIMSMMNRTPEARPGYRDIIAELNAFSKMPARKNSKPMEKPSSTAPEKRKTQPLSNRKTNRIRTSHIPRRKKSTIPFIAQIILFLALLAVGYYAWTNGYLADYIPNAPRPQPKSYDYHPDVTTALSEGKTRRAIIQAKEVLDSPDETLEAKKQAAIQLVLANYLNAAANPEEKCREIMDQLRNDGVEIDAPELAVLSYLTKQSHPPERMRRALESKDTLKLAGEIAVFLKNAMMANPSEVRDAYKRYNVALSSSPKNAWERCFQKRIKIWYGWIFMRKGNSSSLENLIASTNLSSASLTKPNAPSSKPGAVFIPRALRNLTVQYLQSTRGFAAKRPRPPSFNFSQKQLQTYFSSLPPNIAAKEKTRSEQIAPLKRHLCAMMFHMPYTGQKIRLRNGKIVRGKVMVNPKYLSIRGDSNGHRRIYWKDLAPSQFAIMLAYFAQTRIDMEKKRDGAQDYMRAALFCDWYGLYDDAVKYAKAAAKADPSLTSKITSFLVR